MKYIIILIVIFTFVISFCFASMIYSCENKPSMKKNDSATEQEYTVVTEVTANGETHEYLYIDKYARSGITHLPNCKYCNSKNQ